MEIYIIDIWLSKLKYGWSINDVPEKIREAIRGSKRGSKLESIQLSQ